MSILLRELRCSVPRCLRDKFEIPPPFSEGGEKSQSNPDGNSDAQVNCTDCWKFPSGTIVIGSRSDSDGVTSTERLGSSIENPGPLGGHCSTDSGDTAGANCEFPAKLAD